MPFARRAISGLTLTAITIGLIGAAGWRLHSAVTASEPRQRPPARERVYASEIDTLLPRSISPVVVTYGQVQTWNSLEIRAPAAGPVTEISANFRDGLSVEKGELLFRIDPEIAERRVIDARAALAQANTELSEAALSLRHVEAEVTAANLQANVRRSDLKKKQDLLRKKLTTSTIADDARLALSAAEQAIMAKEQAVLAMKSRIDTAQAGVERARLTLSDAERALQDTSYNAPFSGRLSDVAATLGRRVSQNEKLGLLIDPNALEVSFPVRNSEFGNLLDPAAPGKVAALPVSVELDLSNHTINVAGVLDRTAAVAGTQAGRTVFARLTGAEATALRPGDFVTVRISEPRLDDVVVIPASAASDDGRILLVGEDNRLVEHQTRILRRQDDELIVDQAPHGRQYVKLRLPFLAPGVKIIPRDTSQPGASGSVATDSQTAGRRPDRPAVMAGGEASGEASRDSIEIDDARRAALIEHVKSSSRMPEDRRARVLEELAKPAPLRDVVERIERQIARRKNRS